MRAVTVLFLLASCSLAAPQSPEPVTSLSGCYALEIGAWSRPWPAAWQPPAVVRLDSVPAPHRFVASPELLMLRPLGVAPARRSAESAFWRVVSRDSIGLQWGGDYVRVAVRLERGRDGLRGWAGGYTDVVQPPGEEPRALVRGRRLGCPPSLASPVNRDGVLHGGLDHLLLGPREQQGAGAGPVAAVEHDTRHGSPPRAGGGQPRVRARAWTLRRRSGKALAPATLRGMTWRSTSDPPYPNFGGCAMPVTERVSATAELAAGEAGG